jgi:peptidoglycan/xylan/chitin deacetylase (PgdA/CDA1 family)
MSATLPVLMYHGLHEAGAPNFDPVYSVTPRAFAAQLDLLAELGLRPLLLRELDGVPPGDDAVVITFDDGDASNHDVALPLLRERGMAAEFFVTADFVGRPGMLGAAQVRALADAGMSVQSHGRTHRFLSDLPDAELEAELHDSRRVLESLAGRTVDALALPGGRGGARELRAAHAAGYRHLLGSRPGVNRGARGGCLERIAVTRDLALPRLRQLLRWHGAAPRLARWRYEALQWPKRVLGNRAYERMRALVVRP